MLHTDHLNDIKMHGTPHNKI